LVTVTLYKESNGSDRKRAHLIVTEWGYFASRDKTTLPSEITTTLMDEGAVNNGVQKVFLLVNIV